MSDRLNSARRVLPLPGGADHADARRRRGDLRGARERVRLRPPRAADPRADRLRARATASAIRWVPGHLANPVWVDDENFDVTYHVRRSALPKPGTDAQLRDLVARIMSRPLDRNRPLWEMYLVEGLEDDRFAILTKTHHAMVDGVSAVDIGQVILDVTPEPRETPRRHLAPGARALVGRARRRGRGRPDQPSQQRGRHGRRSRSPTCGTRPGKVARGGGRRPARWPARWPAPRRRAR